MARRTRAIAACFLLCCDVFACKRENAEPERSPQLGQATGAASAAATSRAALRLMFVTDLEGVLEPCGCTSRPRGGIDRLSAALQDERREVDDTLLLSAGELFSTADSATSAARRIQDTWKTDALAAVLAGFRFAALAAGRRDCVREPGRIATLARESKAVLVSAGTCGSASEAPVPSALLHGNGIDVGLAAIDDASAGDLARQLQSLHERGAALTVVFEHGGGVSTRALADDSGADFVVHTGGGAAQAAAIARDKTVVLQGARHGEELLVLDVWPGDGATAWRIFDAPPRANERGVIVRRRAIDRDAPADAKVRVLLDQLFARINAHNAAAARDTDVVSGAAGASGYVGSRTCAACHTPAYFWWQRTPHAHAFASLVARGRQLDLDCTGCHVTGFERPGGSTIGHLDELTGVGCESCHGPGSAHVDNPQQPGGAIRREVPEATCVECHDRAHSDLFQYVQARAQLLAPAHGAGRLR